MKKFLHLMGGLWLEQPSAVSNRPSGLSNRSSALNRRLPTQYPLSPNTYKRIPLILIILVFVSCGAAMAQEHGVHTAPAAQAESEIIPLKIGDKIPEELWDLPLQVINHPEGKESITLNDYRGKLIILDFWATWCGSCIEAMPRMSGIENKFSNEVTLLSITKEDEIKTSRFLKNNIVIKDLGLSSIVNDSLLSKVFVHRIVPHLVIINSYGIVKAIASPAQITEKSIQEILNESPSSIPIKSDFDLSKPLFASDDLPFNQLYFYSVLTRGKVDGLPGGTRFRKTENQINGITLTNTPLLSMYKIALQKLYPGISNKQIILKSDDLVDFSYRKQDLNEDWKRGNYYNYELIVTLDEKGNLYERMLEDLDRYSGHKLIFRFEKKDCLVLGKTKDKESAKETTRLGVPLKKYILEWNSIHSDVPLLIDTMEDIADNLDFNITAPLEDMMAFREELRQYGVQLVEKQIEMPVCIIYKSNDQDL